MKNSTIYLLLAGFLLFSMTATAQPRAGLKAGVNYGGLSGYEGGKKTGFHAGVSMQWILSKKWKVQPELLFSTEAQGYTVEVDEAPVQRTLSMSYAHLPVLFQYFASSRFYIGAGPQLSFLAGAKDKDPGGKADVKRNLSNTQFAFLAGAGYMIEKRLEIYLRYNLGLTDITLFDANTDCSRVAQAGISYRLK